MQRFIRTFAVTLGFLMTSGLGTSAWAQAQGYVGGFGGLSVPDYEDSSARPMFGILGGARLDGELGLGAYYLTSSQEEDINEQEVDFDYSLYGLEGSFHFEGVADGAFVGVRVGLSKITLGDASISPMHYGVVFGYDHFLSEQFSLGAEAGFLSVASDNDTVNGAEVEVDGFTMLNFAAAAKLWF